MNRNELNAHMVQTSFGLRWALCCIAFGLPLTLLVLGRIFHGVWIEKSISSYYYSRNLAGAFGLRDIFVGGLVAAAVCLFAYRGYRTAETLVLKLAGVFALLVAMLPSTVPGAAGTVISQWHTLSAIAFFACLVYTAWRYCDDTLDLWDEANRRYYDNLYWWTGWGIVGAVVLSGLVSAFIMRATALDTKIFMLETFAMWAFGLYWTLKTKELKRLVATLAAADRAQSRTS